MPSWLLLSLFIAGCTLVVPLFVLGNTQSGRRAFEAWWFFAKYLLALAVPAAICSAIIWSFRAFG